MREFTWHVFTQTGDIEAYLLYKEMDAIGTSAMPSEDEPGEDGGGAPGEAPQS